MMNEEAISQKVLCVDDEPRVLDGIRRQLRKEFAITIAESAAQGLQILASEGPFAMVISDYNMPVTDGIEFLNQVHERYPETVLVMLTGRAELDVAVKALHKGHISRFLNKPCPKELLVQTINDGLKQYHLIINESHLKAQLALTNQQLSRMNEILEERVKERTATLATQYHFVSSLTQMGSSFQVAEALVNTLQQLDKIAAVRLFLRSETHRGTFFSHDDNDEKGKAIVITELENGILSSVIQSGQIMLVNSEHQISASDTVYFAPNPSACLPLKAGEGVIGLLLISLDNDCQLDDTDINSINTLANATASSLMSHWHLEARNESQDAIITSLAKLSEYRDNETGAHLLRLKKYCRLICEIMGQTDKYRHIVTEQFTEDLVRASPMHDIGKVGIPDAILKKPGKLTDDEFVIMKTHASIGGDTLRAVFERYKSQTFIKSGMEVAYYHHEKWDGTGYPHGLSGEDIPLSARILMVADVYDALTTQRVYKPAFSREKAKAIVEEGSGTHFDPDVVVAFLENEADFHRIAGSMADEPILF